MNAADYVALHAKLTPRRLAAVELDSQRSWSYAELDRDIARCASVLKARGCGRGERVVVLCKNHVLAIVLHHACARIGAIYTPLNFRLAPAEVEALIARAAPRLVIGDARLSELPAYQLELQDLARELAGAEPAPHSQIDPDAPSLLLFTSGTSGTPKGALISERNLLETVLNFTLLGRVTADSVFLCDAPMFHVIGLVSNVRPALFHGGTCLVSSGFEPPRSLARLSDPTLRISHYFCVPQMLAALVQQPGFEPAKLAHLTAIFTGGSPHAADSIRAHVEAGLRIAHGYGMTEVGCIFGSPIDAALVAEHAGSVGVCTPRVQLRIVDDAGNDCPPDVPGELIVRGDTVFLGYFQDAEASAAAFRDGWFHTGDICRRDADGYYYVVDRKKDMFISGGENVYPAEIEAQLHGFPGLRDAAVVGVPDARWGEVGHLAFVAEPGAGLAADDILRHLEGRLARFKLPKLVTELTALPRTASGKLQRLRLRELLSARAQDSTPA
jgi:fatty-acyl-CoA synthase